MLPIAVDAMGGDAAPGPIVAGAFLAAQAGTPVVLVGPADLDRIDAATGLQLDLIEASEVIGMHDDPAQGVRRKKDSTLVRAAEAVRDGRASAIAMPAITSDRSVAWVSCCASDRSVSDRTRSR